LVWAEDRIINIIAGKVNNIIQAEQEVKQLMTQIKNNNINQNSLLSLQNNTHQVVAPSVLNARREIQNQDRLNGDSCSLSMSNWGNIVQGSPAQKNGSSSCEIDSDATIDSINFKSDSESFDDDILSDLNC